MNYFKQYLITTLASVIITLFVGFGVYLYMPIGFLEPQNDTVGASITTINGSDTLSSSRGVINTNFANLNSSKMEGSTTSVSSIISLPNLGTIGTIISGIWHGTIIDVLYGGTGRSFLTANSILLGNGSGGIATTTAGTDGQQLTFSSSSKPYWSTAGVNQAADYSWSGTHTFSGTTTGLYNFIYGDGSDGTVTISATTTLTRDMYYSSLTVNSGVTLDPRGYKIFVRNTLTNNGFISRNAATAGSVGTQGGDVATNGNGGGGAGGAAGISASSTGTIYGAFAGGAGGAGGNGNGTPPGATAGSAGVSATNSAVTTFTGSTGGAGGLGSTDGVPVVGAGGASGTISSLAGVTLRHITNSLTSFNQSGYFGYLPSNGGGGGGTGAGMSGFSYAWGGGGGGGGAGGNGGYIFIYARSIVNTGSIVANGTAGGNGGRGGNASGGTQSRGGGGGGGGAGGNGGILLFVYDLFTNSGTITANGGSAGSGGAAGTGTTANGAAGANGNAGAGGFIYYLQSKL